MVGITAKQVVRGRLGTWGDSCLEPQTLKHTATAVVCVFIKQPGVCLTIAISFTNSHPEGELPFSLPLIFLEEEGWSLLSSSQLVCAAQNLHYEKRMNECDLMCVTR